MKIYAKKLIYIALCLLFPLITNSQNLQGHTWLRQNHDELISMRWIGDSLVTQIVDTTERTAIRLSDGGGVVSDAKGKLKFYGTGCGLHKGDYAPLDNGYGLNPGKITDSYCIAVYPGADNLLILPMPEDTNRYIVLHEFMDKGVYVLNDTFGITSPVISWRYSEIDVSLNNGQGGISKKNLLLLNDTLSYLGLHACRHANGRDWWIIAPQIITVGFQRAILTKNGIQYIGEQRMRAFSDFIGGTIGQANFSIDGTQFTYGSPRGGIYIFDFDRCTGLFSNPRQVPPHNPFPTCTGLSFSPNSRFLYESTGTKLYQYDLTETDLVKSRILIDTLIWGQARFYRSEVAPDKKIYLATTSSNNKMHIIDYPDRKGTACSFRQQGLILPTMAYIGMPNLPNYQLGASNPNCQLPVATRDAPQIPLIEVSVYPNPTYYQLNVNILSELSESAIWQLYNEQGQAVFHATVANGINELTLPATLPPGLYLYQITSAHQPIAWGKVVLME